MKNYVQLLITSCVFSSIARDDVIQGQGIIITVGITSQFQEAINVFDWQHQASRHLDISVIMLNILGNTPVTFI